MTRGDGVDDEAVGTTVGVATALEELKSDGSALLVAGAVPGSIYAQLSAGMLGEGADRRRLLVEQGRSPDARLAAVDRWTPEWTRVFRCQIAPARSSAGVAATQSGSDADGSGPGSAAVPSNGGGYDRAVETVDGSIADLGVAVCDAIGWFDDVAGGLDPAELRVAFDCVSPLLSAYSPETVFRFFHLFTHQIRAANGMGHVRLSRPVDSAAVRRLAPLFDAIVELDLDGSEPIHRWHFRDAAVTSEWLPIDGTA
jgi:hypothetical protein